MRRAWCCGLWTMAACGPVLPIDGEGTSGTQAESSASSSGEVVPPGTSGVPSTSTFSTSSPVTTDPSTVTVVSGPFDTGEVETGIDPTDPIPELCLPVELHGPALEFHPGGWVAFAGCDPEAVILQTEGAPPLLTSDVLSPVADTYGMSLFGMPGAQSTGVGRCCPDDDALCLVVDVNRWDLQITESLAYATELFASLEGACVGVRLNPVGAEGPRCEADDPSCVSEPVCADEPIEPCCNAPAYDPGAARTPIAPELSAGSCSHDGDCLVNGVRCADYMSPQLPAVSQCTDEISQAFCGCVANSCTWYDQG